jgi:hypothetical protein
MMHIEVEFMEIYSGQPLFKEVKKYLVKNNFVFIGFTSKGKFSADAVFINKTLYDKSKHGKLL